MGCLLCASAARAEMAIAQVSPGIYRGPAPECADDYRQLSRLGIKTVLDLRSFRRRQRERECACLKSHGITFLNVPVSFRPQRDGSAERALRILRDAERGPIYIHCEYGRDRSGLIIGLFRVRCEGWSLRAAYCEMRRFGFNSRLRGLERYFWECARRGAGRAPLSGRG